MQKFMGGYSHKGVHWICVEWVAENNWPFCIVKDATFLKCPTTVSYDVKDVWKLAEIRLIQPLKICHLQPGSMVLSNMLFSFRTMKG